MTADLVEWLRAQLDEDERLATQASFGLSLSRVPAWNVVVMDRRAAVVAGEGISGHVVARTPDPKPRYARHIAEHDPARVLREVEAKRRMLALAETHLRFDGKYPNPFYSGFGPGMLIDLASVYSHRAGFKAEWSA